MTTGEKGAKVGHTAGPWKVGDRIHDYERDYYWCVTVFADNADSGNKVPAEVFAKDREQARANATLIASAPELLEACKQMVAVWGVGYDVAMQAKKQMEEAIAKAEGRA